MGFLKRLLGLEPNLMKLLSAHIVVDEDHRYFVSFHRHHPELQLPEFVRLVLHYYAKILFNFDPSDPQMAQSASTLKRMMDSVVTEGVDKDSDILTVANIDDVAQIVTSRPKNDPREIVATLFFVSATRRHITTDIPTNTYVQQMVFSVMVLLQVVINQLDEECVDVLIRALSRMNEAYSLGQEYSDMDSLSSVPNMAYLSAVTGG